MQQSKVESAIEATMNIATGAIISYGVWMVIIVPLVEAGVIHVGPAGDAVIITGIFTVTSWLRSFFWRRYFNAGLHKVAHSWAKEIVQWKTS